MDSKGILNIGGVQKPSRVNILRRAWRSYLRFRRIARTREKTSLVTFIKLMLIDFVLGPLFTRLGCERFKVKLRIRGFPHPFFLRPGSTDFDCLLEVILEEEYATACALQPRADLIIDAGANVGYSARYFLRAYPNARIICVEPDASNMEMLRLNIELAGASPRCVCALCCVAETPRIVYLDRSRGAWAIRMSQDIGAGQPLFSKTMDGLLEEAGFPEEQRIDLLKCDVEGAEADIFRHPGNWLNRVSCLAVETHAPYWATSLMDDIKAASEEFSFIQEDELVFAQRTTLSALRN